MDMWITKDPDAGHDFDAPMREIEPVRATARRRRHGAPGTGGDRRHRR